MLSLKAAIDYGLDDLFSQQLLRTISFPHQVYGEIPGRE